MQNTKIRDSYNFASIAKYTGISILMKVLDRK
jgi:hypothetical protein